MSETTMTVTPASQPSRRRNPRTGDGPLWWVLIAGFSIAFLYVYVGGNYDLYRLWTLNREKSHLEREVSALQARRFDLAEERRLLQQDPKTDLRLRYRLEELAREEYGLARRGELIYRFAPGKPPHSAVPTP